MFGKETLTIVLDPGHGGKDPGAPGDGIHTEATINYYVAEHLAEELLHRGYNTFVTRGRNETMGLGARPALAEAWGADIFISIHCNSWYTEQAQGAECFYYPDSRKGELLAGVMQAAWVVATGMRDRGAKPGRYHVLKRFRPADGYANSAAALLELGFISNKADRASYTRAIASPRYRKKLINSLAQGIINAGGILYPDKMPGIPMLGNVDIGDII